MYEHVSVILTELNQAIVTLFKIVWNVLQMTQKSMNTLLIDKNLSKHMKLLPNTNCTISIS